MKYFILLASVLFLAQSCSVAPSMRESADRTTGLRTLIFPGNQK